MLGKGTYTTTDRGGGRKRPTENTFSSYTVVTETGAEKTRFKPEFETV